jgi:hypothetical protein
MRGWESKIVLQITKWIYSPFLASVQVYKPGSPTLNAVVEAFGADILAEVNEPPASCFTDLCAFTCSDV